MFATDVPARLDRLPWSGFHWLVIVALGIAWVLDGLEVVAVPLRGGLHLKSACSALPDAPSTTGWKTIRITSPLPALTASNIRIDGASQPRSRWL